MTMFRSALLFSLLLLIAPGCAKKSGEQTATSSRAPVPAVTDVLPSDAGAPAFAWTDSSGRRVTFEQFRGSITVVNFWATWCGPCKKELPDLVELSKELAPQGITFLGISTDAGPGASDKVNAFIESYGIPYTIVLSNDDLEEAFGNITGLPTTLLVGKNGEIRKTIVGSRTKAQFMEAINAARM